MENIINLLPDNVANQIAAGEVVQRPASVVKELLENSIDAGATEVKLIVEDAGKGLIQVIDNGKGMSPTDIRMCLERHATSKIKNAEDLFHITTMGFRGEALASIVAISEAEIKSKRSNDELANIIKVAASKVTKQEPCTSANGTSISIKNLFYNIPARRKFLKKNAVEGRHIIDQFERIALVHPDVKFQFYQDGSELFHLEAGSFRQRLVAVFGKNFNDRLVPVKETTDIVSIKGFICKPEYARKTRGEQYFFANNRFIKNHYLHHAVQQAFEELIPKGYHPSYFLKLDLDPSSMDINIHPTKTEIKFEDEKAVYAIIRSSVKKALGEHNITPSLDFNRETSFDQIEKDKKLGLPGISVDPEYNPFNERKKASGIIRKMDYSAVNPAYSTPVDHWENLIQNNDEDLQPSIEFETLENEFEQNASLVSSSETDTSSAPEDKIIQLHNRFIIIQIKSGMMIIDQQRAHERILFERYLGQLAQGSGQAQQLIFPENIDLNPNDADLLNELLPQLRCMGFDIDEFGKNAFIVRGMPSEIKKANALDVIDGVIGNYKLNDTELKLDGRVNLAYSLAQKSAVKSGRKLDKPEMQMLIDELFACENPNYNPAGKRIIQNQSLEQLLKSFE